MLVNIFLLLFTSVLCESKSPFQAIWNVPLSVCSVKYDIRLNLTNYGITVNDNGMFRGDQIVIFYETLPGLYPKILTNGTAVNGGVPQQVSLERHFRKSKGDIKNFIPARNFSGLAVIDWESWRPIYDRNRYEKSKLVYIRASENLVRSNHPTWNQSRVAEEAKLMFQKSARNLMLGTLLEGKKMRPNGLWGFYGFPRCNNYEVEQNFCTNSTMKFNDQLEWMFAESSALFPSIYLSSRFPSPSSRQMHVQGILNETIRIHQKFSKRSLMFAYTVYRFTDSQAFYAKEDLLNTIGQSFDAGMDGVALWDSSSSFTSRAQCLSLKTYVDVTLGPFIDAVITFAEICSKQLCNYHGKCVRKSWTEISGIRNLYKNRTFSFINYVCECYLGWSGAHCNVRS